MATGARGTQERRAELLEAARKLFVRDGFTEVSVSQIVRGVGVAQGTFYYYFDSKEAALDALVQAYVGDLAARLSELAADERTPPQRALQEMVRTELDFDERRARELGAIRGADAHTKLFSAVMRTLAPVYARVLARGEAAGVFRVGAPDLMGEIVVLTTHSLFDRDLMGWSDREYARRRRELAALLCAMLGLARGELELGSRKGKE